MSSNPMMVALMDAVKQGSKFSLTQKNNTIVLEVTGGFSSISLTLPFSHLTGHQENDTIKDFTWKSNSYTAGLLVSAVEGMPEEAAPSFVLNTSLWDGGGLVLHGNWETARRRAKTSKVHDRYFLVDAGVCVVK